MVVSVLVLAYQGRELAGHTRIANEVAGTQAHRELLFHWKSVIDVFVRHPELHGLYFGTTSRAPSADDAVRLNVIAEQHADWLDTTLMTETQLGSYLYREWVGGWRDFAVKSVAESPALRSLIGRRPMERPMLDSLVAAYESAHRDPRPRWPTRNRLVPTARRHITEGSGTMTGAPARTTADLSGYPDLVVIYLGMRVEEPRGLETLQTLGPQIEASVAERPDGLLLHERLTYSQEPMHVGMRQYWRDFDSLLAWTLTLPHKRWWSDYLKDRGGTSFWHETYFRRGGFESMYVDVGDPGIGMSLFAPVQAATGPMLAARARLEADRADAVTA